MPTARGSCVLQAVPKRQMDVVSGLINVLTGQRFTGRSHEGVHKSAPDIYSVSKTGVTLVWFPHSAAVCIAGQIRATWRSTTRYSPLPARIQIDGKASQSPCAHEFITEHNGTQRRRGTKKKKKHRRSQGQTNLRRLSTQHITKRLTKQQTAQTMQVLTDQNAARPASRRSQLDFISRYDLVFHRRSCHTAIVSA